VRLVIPQPVLDELDDKRYLGRADVKERARSAVRPLDELQGQFESQGFAMLPDGSTVEYLKDGDEQRHPNPDEDILDRAGFLAQVTGRTVGVITADRGMRVRATGRDGLRAILMPERYSRDQPTGAG
jgi:predicted ribonuclease YlaK